MKAIVNMYSKYLATLAKPELTEELPSLQLQPPPDYSKQGYIETLTTSNHIAMQQRLQQLELESNEKQTSQNKSQL